MKRLIKFMTILSVLVLTGCGKSLFDYKQSEGGRVNQSTDSVFTNYISKFEAHGRTQLNDPTFSVGNVVLNFGDVKSFAGEQNHSAQAVCVSYSDGKNEIIIDKEWFSSAKENQREALISHELGHCVLGRTHDNQEVLLSGKSVKKSLMNPVVPNSTDFLSHYDYYFQELFKK